MFSLLTQEPIHQIPPPVAEDIPSITPAGINIFFPARHCEGYLNLITNELCLKRKFTSSKRPISSLWFRGYPFRQCKPEELTELVFRICTNFNLKQPHIERAMTIGPEDCTNDNLALIKGLGFGIVTLLIDATIATTDRSTETILNGLRAIQNYSEIKIRCEILYGPATSPEFAKKLVTCITGCNVEEVELNPRLTTIHNTADDSQCRKTFLGAAPILESKRFELFGDRSFKSHQHPDQALRKAGILSYAPWGYHPAKITNWLGLGLDATGILEGYIYRNTNNIDTYRRNIENHQMPITGWTDSPLTEQPNFKLLQNIYCYQLFYADQLHGNSGALEQLLADGWIIRKGDRCKITLIGAHNIETLCQLLISPR